MTAEVVTLREPEPGKAEIFVKTEDGEFTYAVTESLCWALHEQTGAILKRAYQRRLQKMTKDVPEMGFNVPVPKPVKRKIIWGCAAVAALALVLWGLL